MHRYIQIHALTSYPLGNPNRDDQGEPKQAKIGGTIRMRISSQCLKRTWRLSEVFATALAKYCGVRTRNLGKYVNDYLLQALLDKGAPADKATEQAEDWAVRIATQFVKLKAKPQPKKARGKKGQTADPEAPADEGTPEPEPADDKKGQTAKTATLWAEQVVFLSPSELAGIEKMCRDIVTGAQPTDKELQALVLPQAGHDAVDIALFGRMMASAKRPTEAAVSGALDVAHAFSVSSATAEDDYFSAVDDWSERNEETTGSGSAHNSTQQFASGMLYHYVCLDVEQFMTNLAGDKVLADAAIRALIEAMLTTTPSGKRHSFAHHQMAAYALVEVGDAQPYSYADEYKVALSPKASTQDAIDMIQAAKQRRIAVQPARLRPALSADYSMVTGTGTFDALIETAVKALG